MGSTGFRYQRILYNGKIPKRAFFFHFCKSVEVWYVCAVSRSVQRATSWKAEDIYFSPILSQSGLVITYPRTHHCCSYTYSYNIRQCMIPAQPISNFSLLSAFPSTLLSYVSLFSTFYHSSPQHSHLGLWSQLCKTRWSPSDLKSTCTLMSNNQEES